MISSLFVLELIIFFQQYLETRMKVFLSLLKFGQPLPVRLNRLVQQEHLGIGYRCFDSMNIIFEFLELLSDTSLVFQGSPILYPLISSLGSFPEVLDGHNRLVLSLFPFDEFAVTPFELGEMLIFKRQDARNSLFEEEAVVRDYKRGTIVLS